MSIWSNFLNQVKIDRTLIEVPTWWRWKDLSEWTLDWIPDWSWIYSGVTSEQTELVRLSPFARVLSQVQRITSPKIHIMIIFKERPTESNPPEYLQIIQSGDRYVLGMIDRQRLIEWLEYPDQDNNIEDIIIVLFKG